VADAPDATVHYTWLNDYGGPVDGDAHLGPGATAVSK
jgi:hypothetical protein